MHPILGNLRRLGLYLLGWIPLAGLVVYLLVIGAGFRLVEAVVLGVPLCLLYAFFCLSSWYACRWAVVEPRPGIFWLGLTYLAAAAIESGLWLLIARASAPWLSRLTGLAGIEAKVPRASGLIFGMGVFLYLLSVALHHVLIATEASRQAEERALEARVHARDAELRALKAQVNPHFIFNCLHSISALTSADPARAREMCILLGDFLRRTLGLGQKTVVPLEEELALIHCFLQVEKVRFGARLDMQEEIDAGALGCLVPPLLLQPLVENAVAHGIAHLPEGGWIRLSVKRKADDVAIVVENRFDPEAPPSRRNGLGLENVRQRLAACYADRARMSVTREGEDFRVNLLLPAEGPVKGPEEKRNGAA